MNGNWFGDSYDIVKRFFVGQLKSLGYAVYVDPMSSGDWSAVEPAFLSFVGARHVREGQASGPSALLLDPDTGIGEKRSHSHVPISEIFAHLAPYEIVFVFDQSFSRGTEQRPQILGKLEQLRQLGACGFYYDSHARFLFASRFEDKLKKIRDAFLKAGLPASRLVGHE